VSPFAFAPLNSVTSDGLDLLADVRLADLVRLLQLGVRVAFENAIF
jgi:hypothetical protein